MNKWVYNFGSVNTEGNDSLVSLLGNKGAHLANMSLIGISVPPGFTITTEVCNYYFNHNFSLPTDLSFQVDNAIAHMQKEMEAVLGCEKRPLLISVRSGAQISMPGMMDTILNLGLNDRTVEALAKITNNERFAYDCYRRFIQMYSQIVLAVDHYHFEDILELMKQDINVEKDSDLGIKELKELVSEYKEIVKKNAGEDFPQDINIQLWNAIKAVFKSWNNPRACKYRKIHNLQDELGTAVTIQAMVFGNMDDSSATGVAFTRDPSTGKKYVYGEYLINAQGEDVVAGIRTPQVISNSATPNAGVHFPSLESYMPECYNKLTEIFNKLEIHYKDMQDVEFTIQQNKIWILQTRSGKRSAKASIQIAADMVQEGLIDEKQALLNINAESIEKLLHPTIDPTKKYNILTKGLPASPGAATGKVYFSADKVEQIADIEKTILVRHETSPEDIHGMNVAEGILTTRGGMTSHAAVVARGMGKSCVCGAGEIMIDYEQKQFSVNDIIIKEGDIITINGSNGEIIVGEVETILPELVEDFVKIMSWAKKYKKVNIRANADTPNDSKIARDFGAEGIGLCRTEHMFFNIDRINVVREMILSDSSEARQNSLEKLLRMQITDFTEILVIMDNLPVNIRLLDPPLHEFLPIHDNEINNLAKIIGLPVATVKSRIEKMKEQNPMLGHRGCRLGISHPEIYEMQARAIFTAMKLGHEEKSLSPNVEIMIPLVITVKEFEFIKAIIDKVAAEILGTKIKEFNFQIGTMIELPRACLIADEIAKHAEFFSFGTNDLTQTTLGLSRDDASNFLNTYLNNEIFITDPFIEIDKDGVGELIKIAVNKGRTVNPELKIGICGEHGGNPNSIEFFCKVSLDYVSCSPYRVPIAILAAAQTAINESLKKN